MEKYRCFVAVDLPDKVKEALAAMQEELKVWPGSVKWVEQRNFHLTLKFLGDITGPVIKEVQSALEKAAGPHTCFTVYMTGAGAFPSVRNPRVIWAGIDDPGRKLGKLWTDIERVLVKNGFEPEKKSFSPHLTLGRVKDMQPPNERKDRHGMGDILKKLHGVRYPVPVSEIKLVKSRLFRSGPEYSCLASCFLQEHL